jgi:excisionase family DNA binding protein
MVPKEPVMARALTLGEVADFLRIHPSTVYRMLRKKELPAFKASSDWRSNLESIARWRAEGERYCGGAGGIPQGQRSV